MHEPPPRQVEHEPETHAGVERARALQSVVADLGLVALRSSDLQELKREATERLCAALDADFCKLLRLDPGGGSLRLEAGTGWREGTVGGAVVGADRASQAGYTLTANEPVVVRDLRRETRFHGPPLLREHDVVSGVSVVVHGADAPYGVLGVHTRDERAFDVHEVHFVQSVANVLAEAIARHRQEGRVRRLAERLTITLESITDGFATIDRAWRVTYLNGAAEEVLSRSRRETVGRNLWELFPQAVDTRFEHLLRRAMAEGRPVRFDAPHVPLGIWLRIAAYPSSEGLTLYFQDVTERRRHRQRLELHRRFHVTLAELAQASLERHPGDGFLQRALDEAVRLVPGAHAGTLAQLEPDGGWSIVAASGYPGLAGRRIGAAAASDGTGSPDAKMLRGTPEAGHADELRRSLYEGVPESRAVHATMALPIRVAERLRGYLYLDARGREDGFGSDAEGLGRLFARQLGSVMHRMDLEADLERQARTDPVTGAPNRRHAEELMRAWLEEDRSAALLFLDLDDFKNVNDVYGHSVGDALLREVVRRVAGALGDRAVVSRWGGDEFLILLRDVRGVADAERAAREVERGLAHPLRVGERALFTRASIGVALLDARAGSTDRAILEADIALHRAKRTGKNRAVPFAHEMEAEATRRFTIEAGLREALHGGDGGLRLAYQPRVDLPTGRIVAAEALARWSHPSLGEISPSEFVPLAESSGLIHGLTHWALDRACRQARAWLDAGRPRVISVNLSAENLQREDIVTVVRDSLERYDLAGAWLELEVTETAAMTAVDASIALLAQLRELGVSVALDDFGTAYASLSYLKLLPVDTLKIDRVFVSDLVHGVKRAPSENAIVEGIVGLGKGLGMFVVAEGLETRAQATFLRDVGCDGAQGHYFGRPGPASAIVASR